MTLVILNRLLASKSLLLSEDGGFGRIVIEYQHLAQKHIQEKRAELKIAGGRFLVLYECRGFLVRYD
jgi:hypothetical protein